MMAKGLEDTAFYRYNRFIALNEVGGEPQRIGGRRRRVPRDRIVERARRWPHALSATATHDTKRGEDARARLAVLTELPAEWAEQVREWRRLLRGVDAVRRAARRERRVLLLSVAARRVAAGALRRAVSSTSGALAAFAERLRGAMTQSRARGEAPFDLGRARRALRELRCSALVDAALDARERLSRAVRAVREPHRAARRAQQLASRSR